MQHLIQGEALSGDRVKEGIVGLSTRPVILVCEAAFAVEVVG